MNTQILYIYICNFMYISKDCTWKVWTFWNNSINKKGTKVKLILSEISLNLYIYIYIRHIPLYSTIICRHILLYKYYGFICLIDLGNGTLPATDDGDLNEQIQSHTASFLRVMCWCEGYFSFVPINLAIRGFKYLSTFKSLTCCYRCGYIMV